MKNRIEDLRNHLFQTLEDLRDKESPMDVERARAVATVAQQIIESAKVECEYVKRGHTLKSVFIEVEDPPPFQSKLQKGGIYSDDDASHASKLAAGIKDMREKLNGKGKSA